MICIGDKPHCGIFAALNLRSGQGKCICNQGECIADIKLNAFITVSERHLNRVYSILERKQDANINELESILKIKSIANIAAFDTQAQLICERLAGRLQELRFDVEVVDIKSNLDGKEYAIFATYFSSPFKRTVLIYGDMDVALVPQQQLESWTYPPFEMTIDNNVIYGRGVAHSKGPIVCWIQAIDAWMSTIKDLPVNVEFVIGMTHNTNLKGLRMAIEQRKSFFTTVDLIIYCTNFWTSEYVPVLANAHSGFVRFALHVEKHKQPTSQTEASHEPPRNSMADLCILMNSLTNAKHEINIPDINKHVLDVTQNDWNILNQIELGANALKEKWNVKKLRHEESRPNLLKHMWCLPSLTMHSVKVLDADRLCPTHVVAYFSIRIVPAQSTDFISFLISDHLDSVYRQRQCQNRATLHIIDKLNALREAKSAWANTCAQRAFQRVYTCKVAIAENISICLPILNELRKQCPSTAHSLPLPFCSIHTEKNQVNEGIQLDSYYHNQKLFATLLYEIAQQPSQCKCNLSLDYCFRHGKYTRGPLIKRTEKKKDKFLYNIYEVENPNEVNKYMLS